MQFITQANIYIYCLLKVVPHYASVRQDSLRHERMRQWRSEGPADPVFILYLWFHINPRLTSSFKTADEMLFSSRHRIAGFMEL